MRAEASLSVASELLRRSLESLPSPSLLVVRSGGQPATVTFANAEARAAGFASGDLFLRELRDQLDLHDGRISDRIIHALEDCATTSCSWPRTNGDTVSLRIAHVTRVDGEHDLFTAAWARPSAEPTPEPQPAGDAEAQTLAAVFAGSPLGIQVFDTDGVRRHMNDAMRKLLGVPAGRTGIGEYRLFDDPDMRVNGLDVAFRSALGGERTKVPRHRVGSAGATSAKAATPQTRWLDAVVFPVRGPGSRITGVANIAWDASDTQQAEHHARQLEMQLRESRKLDTIGRLAGGIAHDFNNILTGVSGFAEMLTIELDGQPQTSELVQQIRKSADRGINLIQQLLMFARQQEARIEVFDLASAAAELLPMLRRLVESNISLTFASSGRNTVSADRSQAQQILVNLFLNAREALPDGGKIYVGVHEVHRGSAPLVEMTVRDNGVGMDAETAAQVFDPFFSTKQEVVGVGLGMSAVYGIVRKAGGSITLDSRPGGGTAIRVLLPRHVEVTEQPDSNGQNGIPRSNGETVLVVDHDDTTRRHTETILRQHGYEVLGAASAAAALAHAIRHRRIDLLVTDVVMPGARGDQLAHQISRLVSGISVVFTSSYSGDESELATNRPSQSVVIAKPFRAVDLMRAAHQAGRKRAASHDG